MPRHRHRVCLEHGLKLDINWLARQGFIRPGASRGLNHLQWTRSGDVIANAIINSNLGDCDPDDWELPPKPKWMRWSSYGRLEDRFDSYEDVLDDNLVGLFARMTVLTKRPG
jgi:hypothetical protein